MKFDLNKTLILINALAPIALANVKGGEKVTPFLAPITAGIVAAEQMKGATGAEKKAHVLAIASAAVATANASGKTAIDVHVVTEAASAGIDATIAAVKAIERGKVVTVSGV